MYAWTPHQTHARRVSRASCLLMKDGRRLTHDSAVKNCPYTSPNTKRSTADDRKANVVNGANATGRDNEAARDGVSDPNTQPSLPPS